MSRNSYLNSGRARSIGSCFSRTLAVSAVAGAVAAMTLPAAAASITWDGGGADGNTSTAFNWVGDVAPAATGDTLVFAGTTNLAVNNDSITSLATSGTAITFDATAGSFNLGGNQLVVGSGAGAGQVIIQQSSPNPQIISANLKLSTGNGDRSIVFGSGAGSLTLSGNIDFGTTAGDWLFPNTTPGNIILTGTNTGDGKSTASITAGTNTMRAMMRNNVANTVLTLGSDAALGNSGTGDIAIGTASLRGIAANQTLTINTLNGNRNLGGSSILINTPKVNFDGTSNLTLSSIVSTGGNRDFWVINSGQVKIKDAIALSGDQTGRNLFINLSGTGGMVVDGKLFETFHSGGITSTTTPQSTLRKSGSGTLTLNGDSANFNGLITDEGAGGTLVIGNANALGATGTTRGTVVSNGAALDLNGFTIGETLTVNSGGTLKNTSVLPAGVTADMAINSDLIVNTVGDITVTRLIGGSTARLVTKVGAGTLVTSGDNHNNLTNWDIQAGTVIFANTGGIAADRGLTLNGGTLQLSGTNSNLINDNQPFTINSGTFDVNGKGEAIAGLDGAGGDVTNTSPNTATLYVGGGPSGSSTGSYSGLIHDAAGLLKVTKEGSGSQILSGANTYRGQTKVAGGTLQLNVAGGADQPVLGGANVASPGGADIKSGKLVLDYNGATSPAGQVAAIMNNAAYLANFATGQIMTTGTLDEAHTLGWYDNETTKQLTITIARIGDSNVDGIVNFDDLLALAQNYNLSGTATWQKGDFNYDATVSFDDLLVLAQNYGQSASVDVASVLGSDFAANWALALRLAPEPTSLAFVGLAMPLIRRRRA